MTVTVASHQEAVAVPSPMAAAAAAALPADVVLDRLRSATAGLSNDEAARQLRALGPNAVRSHRARALPVLLSQLKSPLLVLLA